MSIQKENLKSKANKIEPENGLFWCTLIQAVEMKLFFVCFFNSTIMEIADVTESLVR